MSRIALVLITLGILVGVIMVSSLAILLLRDDDTDSARSEEMLRFTSYNISVEDYRTWFREGKQESPVRYRAFCKSIEGRTPLEVLDVLDELAARDIAFAGDDARESDLPPGATPTADQTESVTVWLTAALIFLEEC